MVFLEKVVDAVDCVLSCVVAFVGVAEGVCEL